jgi:hypothetical protein
MVNIEWFDAVRKEPQHCELFKQFLVTPATERVPIKLIKSINVRLFGDGGGDLVKLKIDIGIEEPVAVKLQVRLTQMDFLRSRRHRTSARPPCARVTHTSS